MLKRLRVLDIKNVITFHLREVKSVRINEFKFEQVLWLFGNTENKNSVAIKVNNYKPYFYIGCENVSDVKLDTLKKFINDDNRLWDGSFDIVTDLEIVKKLPLVGYNENKQNKYIKLTYRNQSHLWRLRKYFAKAVVIGCRDKDHLKFQLYHDDWGVESMFIHDTKIKMQTWIKAFTSTSDFSKKMTTCNIERIANFKNIEILPIQPKIYPPILCCALRIRCKCPESTMEYPIAPSPKSITHDVNVIVLKIYWMGDIEKCDDITLTQNNDDVNDICILSKFENIVNEYDVDCFVYLPDNCHPLKYMLERNSKLRLSKFKHNNVECMRSKVDDTINHIRIHGRSLLDIQAAMKKMMIEPKLDGFTLKDVLKHNGLLREKPPDAMLHYQFIHSPFNTVESNSQQCKDEVNCLVEMECSNSILLGFVEISSASYTQLTVSICNGQQIRVWKKLISKFHTENILVNKAILEQSPIIVPMKTENSSLPDPPNIKNTSSNNLNINKKKTMLMDVYGNKYESKNNIKKSKKRFQGGYVCEPEAGFYSNVKEATFTFDFSSLYPSIIQSDRICYTRVCYDRKYVDDPIYKKTYIPLNEQECLVLIDGKYKNDGTLEKAITVLPETISEVVMERKKVRNLMKSIKNDKFLYESLDAKQLCCKVFQNAVYGFLGVEKNALLACPVLMATVCRIGQYMIKKVRYLMISEYDGYVVYGDTDSVMVQFPCSIVSSNTDDIFSYYYHLCHRIAKCGTDMFEPPNVLEFETMKYPFWLRKKKNYAAFEFSNVTWKTQRKIAIKGLPFKKRDRCIMVRKMGFKIMQMILELQSHECIIHFINESLSLLVDGKISYSDLSITCVLQEESNYKNTNLIQLETAKKVAKRTGSIITPGCRVSYVVLMGNEKLYRRGEDPTFAEENGMKLDCLYYFEKQLLSAIEPLLSFHNIDLRTIKNNMYSVIKRKKDKTKSLFTFVNRSQKRIKV